MSRYCVKCGEKIKKKYNLCPNCGNKIEINDKEKPKNIYMKILFFIMITILIVLIVVFIENVRRADIEELKKAVVQIHLIDGNKEVIGNGSGVIAFNKNTVLTNAHVVDKGYDLEIISENNTKYLLDGIIAYDKEKDVAILKIKNAKDLNVAATNEKISIGDDVIAIGSPLGLKNTVSYGNLSGLYQQKIEVYQHTAPISPGSSGGALFDKKGKLVGITFGSYEEGQNINLAIPIKYYRNKYDKVKDNYPISPKQYSYLSNKIIKTKYGSKLLNFALNDKYDNEKFKSGIRNETKEKGGYLETCKSLENCIYISKNNYNKIGAYVESSLYLFSGTHSIMGTCDSLTGKCSSEGAVEGTGYTVVVLKKNKNNSNDEELKKFLMKEFESKQKNIKVTSNYIYYFSCNGYDKCNEVNKILNKLVK